MSVAISERLCGGLVHAVAVGYIQSRYLYNVTTGESSPVALFGFPGKRPRGKRSEGFQYLQFCPFCGGGQAMDAPYAERRMVCASPLRMEVDGQVWGPVGFEPPEGD